MIFRDYCAARVDLHEWLRPLSGRHLICTCDKPIEECHAIHLINLCRAIADDEQSDNCDECVMGPPTEWDAEDHDLSLTSGCRLDKASYGDLERITEQDEP